MISLQKPLRAAWSLSRPALILGRRSFRVSAAGHQFWTQTRVHQNRQQQQQQWRAFASRKQQQQEEEIPEANYEMVHEWDTSSPAAGGASGGVAEAGSHSLTPRLEAYADFEQAAATVAQELGLPLDIQFGLDNLDKKSEVRPPSQSRRPESCIVGCVGCFVWFLRVFFLVFGQT